MKNVRVFLTAAVLLVAAGAAVAAKLVLVSPVYITATVNGVTSCIALQTTSCSNTGTKNCEVRVTTTAGVRSTNGYSDSACTILLKQPTATATVTPSPIPSSVAVYVP